jgi:transposase-like protein
MAQHFLLSAAARSLSPAKVMRMSDLDAENVFLRLRWPQTDGKPICPQCGCQICYDCRRSEHQPRWRCKACHADFSVTSGTLFAWHKLPLKTYLMAIAVFCNEVKGKSMLAFSRDLDVQYKTAFVLAHKLREAMASAVKALRIGGEGRTAEIDGAYFGGHIRPGNLAVERIDRRLAENQSGKRHVVVAMRERGGRTLAQVFAAEADAATATVCGLPRAPPFTPMRARPGTRCTPASRCGGSTTRTVTASTAPAPTARNPTSPACGAANLDITTTLPDRILSATPTKLPGARTCGASATASKSTAWLDWRWDAGRRSTSAATGNAPVPPRSAAN